MNYHYNGPNGSELHHKILIPPPPTWDPHKMSCMFQLLFSLIYNG